MSARISDLPVTARLGLLGLALAGAMVSLSLGTRAQREGRAFPPPLSRPLPKGLTRQALSAALADQSRVAADLAYIECLQYIGGPRADGFYGRTLDLYGEVQWLDPGFRHAAREGISVLGWMLRRPDEALELGRRALQADPGEARYGAYMAALAYQKRLDIDGVLAALLPETRRPDAPEMLLRMVGNLYLRQGAWDQAVAYWAAVAPRLNDPVSREQALRSIAAAKAHRHNIYYQP
jgi:tetratricopeptide (TPR) repeat protein